MLRHPFLPPVPQILKWARANGCAFFDEEVIASAASGGHLDVVKYCWAQRCPWNEYTTELAAEGGHLEVYTAVVLCMMLGGVYASLGGVMKESWIQQHVCLDCGFPQVDVFTPPLWTLQVDGPYR